MGKGEGVKPPGLVRMLLRGLRGRCPRCNDKRVFQGWGRMVPRCPTCGHVFEREEGYWVGAIIVNIALVETLFAAILVLTVLFTHPDVPWVGIAIAALATNLVLPIYFYPRSKTTWVALEIHFTPGTGGT